MMMKNSVMIVDLSEEEMVDNSGSMGSRGGRSSSKEEVEERCVDGGVTEGLSLGSSAGGEEESTGSTGG